MFPCQRVGLDFVDTAPFRFVSTVDLAITPEQVWEVLDDAESWPHWATVITKVTWTSPEPHGVGTTRVVNMRGGIVGDEEYLARLGMSVGRPVMSWMFQKFLYNLRDYSNKRYATAV